MKYYCPYCGIRINKNQKRCKKCNYQFRQANDRHSSNYIESFARYDDQYPTYEKRNRNRIPVTKIVYYALVVAIIILLLILLYSLFSSALISMRHHL